MAGLTIRSRGVWAEGCSREGTRLGHEHVATLDQGANAGCTIE
jgi:hypothetical protein